MRCGHSIERSKAIVIASCAVVICLAASIVACSSRHDAQQDGAVETSGMLSSTSSVEEARQADARAAQILVSANGRELRADLEDNPSALAFAELLTNGPLTITMHDYGSMEKVGSIGQSLPTSDMQITTAPGDIILYQGNQLTIYYDVNSWNFTRIGRIEGIGDAELREILGPGDVTVTFSLA